MKLIATAPEAEVRILKSATCSSVSGKSKLTYHIGSRLTREIHFRIFAIVPRASSARSGSR